MNSCLTSPKIRGGRVVLGKLPVPGRPTIWIIVGQGPTALAGVVWTFLLSSILSFLFLSIWETARYRLKYCLKGLLNPKPTNQPTIPQNIGHEAGVKSAVPGLVALRLVHYATATSEIPRKLLKNMWKLDQVSILFPLAIQSRLVCHYLDTLWTLRVGS